MGVGRWGVLMGRGWGKHVRVVALEGDVMVVVMVRDSSYGEVAGRLRAWAER